MPPNGAPDDEISTEARMMADRARERAATLPSAAEIADMADRAMRSAADMSPEEVRRLSIASVAQSARMSYLLGVLAGLTGSEPAGGTGGQ